MKESPYKYEEVKEIGEVSSNAPTPRKEGPPMPSPGVQSPLQSEKKGDGPI